MLLLVWCGIFAVHTTESTLNMFRTRKEMQVEMGQRYVKELEEQKRNNDEHPHQGDWAARFSRTGPVRPRIGNPSCL